jgi:hypothetical protein
MFIPSELNFPFMSCIPVKKDSCRTDGLAGGTQSRFSVIINILHMALEHNLV